MCLLMVCLSLSFFPSFCLSVFLSLFLGNSLAALVKPQNASKRAPSSSSSPPVIGGDGNDDNEEAIGKEPWSASDGGNDDYDDG